MKKMLIVATFFLPFSVYAENYLSLGLDSGVIKHDKTAGLLPAGSLLVGFGYAFRDHFIVDISTDIGSKSSVARSSTCGTAMNACTVSDELRTQNAIFSFSLYDTFDSIKYFVNAGGGITASQYTTGLYSDKSPGTKSSGFESSDGFVFGQAGASTNYFGRLGGGVILWDRHRISSWISSSYGNSTVGMIRQFRVEYNYLFIDPLKKIADLDPIGSVTEFLDSTLEGIDVAVKFYDALPMFYAGTTVNFGRHGFRVRGGILTLVGGEIEYFVRMPGIPKLEANFACSGGTFYGFVIVGGCNVGASFNFYKGWTAQIGVGRFYLLNMDGDGRHEVYNVPTFLFGRHAAESRDKEI